jgi:hypothetical protein
VTATNRPPIHPLIVAIGVLFVVIACATLPGCGASALRVHAGVAHTVGETLDATCHEVQLTRDREQTEAAAAHQYREDAEAAVAGVRERWEPAVHGCNLVSGAHDAWADALVLAAAGEPFELSDGLPFALTTLRFWVDLAALLEGTPVAIPPPPETLLTLTRGAP